MIDADDALVGIFIRLDNRRDAFNLRDDGFAFRRPARFKEFFDARETEGNIALGRDAAAVERAQR